MDLSLLPCRVPLGDARPSDKGSMGKQLGGLLILISHSKLVTSRSAGLQELVSQVFAVFFLVPQVGVVSVLPACLMTKE